MPNPQKPARLWLRKRNDGTPASWVILHGGRQHGTGCAALEVEAAETALETFIAENRKINTRQRDIARIPCADVLSLYLDSLPDNSSRPTRVIHIANLDGFWGDRMLDTVRRLYQPPSYPRTQRRQRTQRPPQPSRKCRYARHARFTGMASKSRLRAIIWRCCPIWKSCRTIPGASIGLK